MPEWTPVVEALPTLMAGRRLIVDVIRQIDADHDALSPIDCLGSLWMEREIKSVEVIPLEKANDALAMLRAGSGRRGATVLRVRTASRPIIAPA